MPIVGGSGAAGKGPHCQQSLETAEIWTRATKEAVAIDAVMLARSLSQGREPRGRSEAESLDTGDHEPPMGSAGDRVVSTTSCGTTRTRSVPPGAPFGSPVRRPPARPERRASYALTLRVADTLVLSPRLFCYTGRRMKSDRPSGAKRGRGRPRHLDPPKMLATNLPTSVYSLLSDLAAALRRTKSQVLTEAIQAYAAKYAAFLPRRKRLTRRPS